MVKKMRSMVLIFSLCSILFGFVGSLHASESLEDGILWLTKNAVREKFGTPNYLYCEEEPFRRYRIVTPDEEEGLKKTFLYDVPLHDLYYLKRNNTNIELRIYYGVDRSNGGETYRVSEYYVNFTDGPVPLGKISELIPECKPIHQSSKVFQEHMFNFDNYRIIFVTDKVSSLTNHFGTIFVDPDKDIKDWSLAYDVILIEGESENVSSNSMVKEIIVSVDGEYRIGKTKHVFKTRRIDNPLQ
ncbi:MAG: hypothetical protein A2W17_11070 [Planctomycetes bacterium RBG_16_41_13]|nr:MAG: hypothetical protein A2W17_11070 [Planctomycetes bacterium RBG_16_41_13]